MVVAIVAVLPEGWVAQLSKEALSPWSSRSLFIDCAEARGTPQEYAPSYCMHWGLLGADGLGAGGLGNARVVVERRERRSRGVVRLERGYIVDGWWRDGTVAFLRVFLGLS